MSRPIEIDSKDDGKAVFFDHRIQPQFFDIIENASESVIFVTPYVRLWDNLRRAMSKAILRGVEITFIIRKEQEHRNPEDKKRFDEDIKWFLENNIQVLEVSRLHVKIYLNEEKILVSSMNVLRSSVDDSLEFAMIVSREADKKMFREYVEALIPKPNPVQSSRSIGSAISNFGAKAASAPTPDSVKLQTRIGHCIRCGGEITFNLHKPYCIDDSRQWKTKDSHDYKHPEAYCHACGKRAEAIAFTTPRCSDCYRKSRSL